MECGKVSEEHNFDFDRGLNMMACTELLDSGEKAELWACDLVACGLQSSKFGVFTVLKLGFRETGRGELPLTHDSGCRAQDGRLGVSTMNVSWIKREPSVVERSFWLDSERGTLPGDVKEAEAAHTSITNGRRTKSRKLEPGAV